MIHVAKGFRVVNEAEVDFFWNSLAFSVIQQMLAIWFLVPLPFLNPLCTSGSSQFMYCWNLAWRIFHSLLWNTTLCDYDTVKGFSIINKAEVDAFLELSCFFDDPTDVRNLISGSSAFLNLAWTSGSLWFMYCWSLAWRILSITLLACEMSTIVW